MKGLGTKNSCQYSYTSAISAPSDNLDVKKWYGDAIFACSILHVSIYLCIFKTASTPIAKSRLQVQLGKTPIISIVKMAWKYSEAQRLA